MSAWMNALGAMLQTGGAIGMKRAQDKQDAQTQLLADQAKESRAELRRRQGPATHFKTKRNGPDGATIEEVNEESYNEETGTRDSRVISTYTSPAKEKRAETAIEYAQRDPAGFAKMQELERGPPKVSAPKVEKDPKPSSLSQGDIDAMFGEVDAEGDTSVNADKYKSFLSFQAQMAAKDPKYNDAQYAKQKWAGKIGFDQNEQPPGTFEIDKALMRTGDEANAALAAGPSAPPAPPAAPPAAGQKPAQAPYPEGTKLTGPDGKTYIVKNGEPVPYGG